MTAPLPSDPGVAAFGASLTAITLAELGDKTFFMALILAARHQARWVFVGAFGALTAVTLISLGLGYGLRELLPPTVLPWLAAALFGKRWASASSLPRSSPAAASAASARAAIGW